MCRFLILIIATLCVCAALGNVSLAAEEETYIIEEYSFEWLVEKAGEVEMKVEKTHESTTITLREKFHFLRMTPENAVKVGEALKTTDTFYAKMRGSKEEMRENVKAGEYIVSFSQDPKYGFSVNIRPAERFGISAISLERRTAVQLANQLTKAQSMAAYVDRVIDAKLK